MKRKYVVILGALMIVLVAVCATTPIWVPTIPTATPNPLDGALTIMLTSHARWQSVSGEADFLWYNDDGSTQNSVDKFALVLPNKIYVEISDHTHPDEAVLTWSTEGENIYKSNSKTLTYRQSPFPKRALNASAVPATLGQITPDVVIDHPLGGLIDAPIGEYIFPVWFPQGHKGDTYSIVQETTFLNRNVWVISLHTVAGDDVTAWVDRETGMIVKYTQMMQGKKFLEMHFTKLEFNGKIAPDTFLPPSNYKLVQP